MRSTIFQRKLYSPTFFQKKWGLFQRKFCGICDFGVPTDYTLYITQGAVPLTKIQVRTILNADVHTDGKEDYVKIRNKVLAATMIVNGWHPIDSYRIKDNHVEHVPHHVDRDGHKRPKVVFQGRHTKRQWPVKNVIGCGCPGDHVEGNHRCIYTTLKLYMKLKDESDKYFMVTGYRKLNAKARKQHVENGELQPRNFFRAMRKKNDSGPERYLHCNMSCNELRERRLRILESSSGHHRRPELHANQARKTFCTLGDKLFKSEVDNSTHK